MSFKHKKSFFSILFSLEKNKLKVTLNLTLSPKTYFPLEKLYLKQPEKMVLH